MTGQPLSPMTLTPRSVASRHSGPADVRLYSRVREHIRARIASGAWQPHDRLPSEAELMRSHGVSRITVRQALGELQNEGLIFKVAGKGSFVAPAKPFQQLGQLQGFAEAMGALGHDTRNRVLSVATVTASDEVAGRLQVLPGTPVTAIRRVRLVDGQPVSLDLTWLRPDVGPRVARADLEARDIFDVLESDCATPLGHADLVMDAVQADGEQAALLGVVRGAPLLHIARLTYDRDGRPLDYEHLFCRADNFQFRLRLQRVPQFT